MIIIKIILSLIKIIVVGVLVIPMALIRSIFYTVIFFIVCLIKQISEYIKELSYI